MYNLGVSYQATGKSHKAFKVFDRYARSYPKGKHSSEANHRMGQILMAKKSYRKAIQKFKLALKGSQKKEVRAEILFDLAKANEKLGDYQTATRRMVKAIDLFAAVPETPPDVIAKSYRKLGETYLKLNAYFKGADAFSMALKFSEGSQDADLKFLLGETYEKSKQLERAQEVFQNIVDSGDPFWARLAKERLRGISIHTKLKIKETETGDELRSM
jgi:tetratricopeptide (TPR) repeat protein